MRIIREEVESKKKDMLKLGTKLTKEEEGNY